MHPSSRSDNQSNPADLVQSKAERGIALIALMVAIQVLSIWLIAAFPKWQIQVQRDLERELIHRGTAIAAAIERYRVEYPAEILTELEPLVAKHLLRRHCLIDPFDPENGWRVLFSSADPQTLANAIQLGQVDQILFDQSDQISGAALVGVATNYRAKAVMKYDPLQGTQGGQLSGFGSNPGMQTTSLQTLNQMPLFPDEEEEQDEEGQTGKKFDRTQIQNWYFFAGMTAQDPTLQPGQQGQPGVQQPGQGNPFQKIFQQNNQQNRNRGSAASPTNNKRSNNTNPFRKDQE